MGSIVKRVNKYAIALASTWGTAVAPGALDGVYFQSFDSFDKEMNETPDMGAGMGIEQNSEQGNDNPVAPNFVVWPYENDRASMLILAVFMGSDVISGVADPYTHKMQMQPISGKFVTIVGEEGTEIKTIPTAVIQSLTVAPNANGIIEFRGQFKGNTVDVSGSVAAVTYKADDLAFLFKNLVLRINDQSGAALSGTDAIDISDFSITGSRPSDEVFVTGATTIAFPQEGEFPSLMLEFKIPHKSAVSNQLYTDWINKTLKKIDMTFSGSGATRELLANWPQAKIEYITNPHDNVISTTVRLRLQKASAPPTGMTTNVPEFVWQNDEAASMLP